MAPIEFILNAIIVAKELCGNNIIAAVVSLAEIKQVPFKVIYVQQLQLQTIKGD